MARAHAEVREAAEFVRTRIGGAPRLGLVLGSGLGAFADELDLVRSFAFSEIPGFPSVSVSGHAGRLAVCGSPGRELVCLQGRVHLYEGRAPSEVVFGVRLLAELGCKAVLLTNAAGGIRRSFRPGDLMLVADHLNLTGQNPLTGPAERVRFPDMTEAYDARLRELGRRAATLETVALAEGVYAGLTGPNYETPAEVRMLEKLGADAVGMSTVLETIALRERAVRVGAVSAITNQAAGISGALLEHAEVERMAREHQAGFTTFLRRWSDLVLEELGNE